MFDKDTLVITYDDQRGEPRKRGTKRTKETQEIAGDCIDCGLCVQVCPTGIDIRNGLQYECIACAACIDVCDSVMTQVKRPTKLIKYTTEARMEGGKKRILRPRIVIYAVLLGLLFIGFITALAMRSSVQFDVLRDRNALYQVVGKDLIANRYTMKVMNKGHVDQRYLIEVEGLPSAKVEITNDRLITSGEVANVAIQVTVPNAELTGKNQMIYLRLTEKSGESLDTVREKTRFFGP
jgi:cytochrome c oxidase accessory protein FixG